MKLNKSIFLTTLLSMGLCVGFVACGDDDDDKGDDKGESVACTDDNVSTECGSGEVCLNGFCSLCGNGKIDEGEVCDIGVDKKKGSSDDVIAEGATCKTYGESSSTEKDLEWVEGGVPSCAVNCKALAKGTCQSEAEAEIDEGKGVNGIVACGSDLSFDDAGKGSAKVTYQTGTDTPDSNVKAGIVCSSPKAVVDADVANATLVDAAGGKGEVSADMSALSAGSYVCYVVVKAGDKGAVVCPLASGKPAKATGSVTELTNSTVEYTVAGEEGTLAEWADFSGGEMAKDIVSDAGLVPTTPEGAAARLKLKLVDDAGNYKILKGQSSVASSITALQLGNAKVNQEGGFPKAKPATFDETNSHLVISSDSFGGKTIEISAKTKNDKGTGGMFSVVVGSTEIIADVNSANEYVMKSAEIPADTSEILIYPWYDGCTESSCGNINIERITIK